MGFAIGVVKKQPDQPASNRIEPIHINCKFECLSDSPVDIASIAISMNQAKMRFSAKVYKVS
jgi:hypothetical protein